MGSYFTSISTDLEQGSEYELTVTTGYSRLSAVFSNELIISIDGL